MVTAARVHCELGEPTATSTLLPSEVVSTTPLPSECPTSTPTSGDLCTREALECKYGLQVCPFGDSYYATLAVCRSGGWKIAMAITECHSSTTLDIDESSTTPRLATNTSPVECPEFSPMSGDECSQSGVQCKYGLYACPLGDTYYTTSASCNGSSWEIRSTSIACDTTRSPTTTPTPAITPATTPSNTTPAVVSDACPHDVPEADVECTSEGLECDYFLCSRGEVANRSVATCIDSSWRVETSLRRCLEPSPDQVFSPSTPPMQTVGNGRENWAWTSINFLMSGALFGIFFLMMTFAALACYFSCLHS